MRTAEELVSAAWLLYLGQAEQSLLAGARACRHMREDAEASLRSALASGDLAGIVAAQGRLETADADDAACQAHLRGIQTLLDRELALRGATVPERAGGPDPV